MFYNSMNEEENARCLQFRQELWDKLFALNEDGLFFEEE